MRMWAFIQKNQKMKATSAMTQQIKVKDVFFFPPHIHRNKKAK